MSSTDNAKPPRPCTEVSCRCYFSVFSNSITFYSSRSIPTSLQYNIFFQIERAYILQVLLNTDPNLEDAEIFNPSHPTYAGRPAMPRRYASLILPYDWHLPGKEARRKRKHRKSHGVIGFHDLSTKIAKAWKSANDEIKMYCSQVCAVGMMRYKAAMNEWKQRGGQQVEPSKKNRRQMMANMMNRHSLVQKPEKIKSSKISQKMKKPEEITSNNNTLMVTLRNVPIQEMSQGEVLPIPTPAVSEVFTIEEMDRAFEDDLLLGDALFDFGDEKMPEQVKSLSQEPFVVEPVLAPISTELVLSASDIKKVKNNQDEEKKVLRNPSIVSYEPVDMDDNEIMDIWNTNGVTPFASHLRTVPIIEQMKLMLEQQMIELERVRQRSVAACTA